MYTRCPHCQAVFEVTTAELTAYDGNVRCGECSLVFNGLDSLSVLPPEGEPLSAEPPLTHSSNTLPDALPGVTRAPMLPVEQSGLVSGRDIPAKPPRETGTPEPEGPDTALHAIPLIIRDDITSQDAPDRRQVLNNAALGMLCALLILLLAAQAVYHERERLLVYPEFAPALRWMCERMGCTLTPKREVGAFQVIDRNIYSHPNVADALMVQATFINRAAFSQPPPQVELSFRDLQGRLMAMRRFTPAEYLQRGLANASLASGDSILLHLEIEDPGPLAVSYEFRFF